MRFKSNNIANESYKGILNVLFIEFLSSCFKPLILVLKWQRSGFWMFYWISVNLILLN